MCLHVIRDHIGFEALSEILVKHNASIRCNKSGGPAVDEIFRQFKYVHVLLCIDRDTDKLGLSGHGEIFFLYPHIPNTETLSAQMEGSAGRSDSSVNSSSRRKA